MLLRTDGKAAWLVRRNAIGLPCCPRRLLRHLPRDFPHHRRQPAPPCRSRVSSSSYSSISRRRRGRRPAQRWRRTPSPVRWTASSCRTTVVRHRQLRQLLPETPFLTPANSLYSVLGAYMWWRNVMTAHQSVTTSAMKQSASYSQTQRLCDVIVTSIHAAVWRHID